MNLSRFSTDKYRWYALVVLALSIAIVIIDNTVLNVAIPYILRDLNTTFDAIQWVISGYALIIATLLIIMGRLGDLYGRKKIFLIGTVFFAVGSFIASIAPNVYILFLGEAFIEAIGAAMLMTSSLSLIASEFQGKERAVAFGIWGSVAGGSASVGPLLGGFLTTYYSWRWSLRINVAVALVAIIGSIFIQESKGDGGKKFDIAGTFLSASGLFILIFGLIEGRKYGWWAPQELFSLGSFAWNNTGISIIPYAFGLSAILLILFVLVENKLERNGQDPLLRMSMFKNRGFSLGLITLGILSMGLIGVFFVLTIYLQNALGLDAFNTGLVFMFASVSVAIFGPLSGFIASKIGPKWISTIGMFVTAFGIFLLGNLFSTTATGMTLAPGLILFGAGIGMASAQLTNIVISQVNIKLAGEASAVNSTVRQIGTSIGIAILGTILAGTLTTNIPQNIKSDNRIPAFAKSKIIESIKNVNVESGAKGDPKFARQYPEIAKALKLDISQAVTDGAKAALTLAFYFTLAGAFSSLFIPKTKAVSFKEMAKAQK